MFNFPIEAGLTGGIFTEDFAFLILYLPCLPGIVELDVGGPLDVERADFRERDQFGVKAPNLSSRGDG